MNREDLIAYATRDWSAVADPACDHWRERKRALGVYEAFRIGAGLRHQVRVLRPDWPRPEDRAEDLEAHARLSERLRSVRPV
jgi:hypothetical protein